MEPPEVLAIHAVPHPNPKVRRVGFTLDDPYVEQVWAAVIGPSALLVLRRLPMLWREREPAVVDLRELGQSLGLGPSLARSGRTWKTIERPVGFGMAHWLPGDELGVRTQVAPLSGRQLARAPEWTRRVHDRLLGTHLDRVALAQTDRTLEPDRFLETARITARLGHLQHRRPPSPAASASNHDRPPILRRRPALLPRGSPAVVPYRQTRRAHPCRCPCGAPAHRPPSVTRCSPSPRWARPAVPWAGSSTPSSAAPRPPRRRSPPRHPPAPH
jgi:hypothetical protein